MMNVYDEDEQNFNFDMIMHDNAYAHISDRSKENREKEEIKKTDHFRHLSMRSRIKTKKGRKLILKKKKEKERRRERDSNEPKVYQCHHPLCEKVFLDRNSYRKHLITHGEKQFVCQAEGCGKRFLDNSKLKRHMLVHTGEKPYKCELCSKRFSLDFNLRTHLRIHTGEKPYVCSFESCYKRFSQSSNLSAHEKTHYMPKDGEPNSRKLSEENSHKKKIFKVLRPTLQHEKPRPVIILDRHRYLDNLKKSEEEKKKAEEEKKANEKVNEKANEPVVEPSVQNVQKSIISNKSVPILGNKIITGITNNSINSSTKDNSLILSSSVTVLPEIPVNKFKPKLIISESRELEQLQEIKKMISLNNQINEEMQLDTTHNNPLADQIEYSIPYYLTREWALKNLL